LASGSQPVSDGPPPGFRKRLAGRAFPQQVEGEEGKEGDTLWANRRTRQGGASCAANQAVELQRKKPGQTAFTTVEQLLTDAGGSFSAKEKVKKTFQYRAQVLETATCDDGVSNTEKVKVKKKR
jgi:hypothetical protein